MRAFAVLLILIAAGNVLAQTTISPTTTLTAETGNNTGAADSFSTQVNGNIGAGNISKMPLNTLLYPGSNTAIYAHFMAWFGQSSHMSVGYTSSDPVVVQKQVNDAISRGMAGFIEDWYGPNNSMPNNTLFALKAESERHPGQFSFGITYDGGALNNCVATPGCDLTQQTISDLTYAWNNFEQSPAYMRLGGRPVLLFFDPDRYGTLNWPLIQSSVPGNPVLIFRNAGGFTHTSTAGSFAWIIIDTTNALNWNQTYLDGFLSSAVSSPAQHAMAATYKGFNDTLAGWTKNRIMSQQCGQVWLDTFNEIGRYYSAAKQLESIQLVTWNDYEEGSELESGIDNCVSLNASVSNGVLSWTLSGDEATVDHYNVFISKDGQNLMSLGDLPSGSRSLNLAGWNFASGSYNIYVKAIARASMTNKMSPAASYTVNGTLPPPGGTPDLTVAASPSALTVKQGQAGAVSIGITPQQGFSGTVTFACSSLPANTRCSFSPASLAASGASVSSVLTVATSAATGALPSAPFPLGGPAWFTSVFAIAVAAGGRLRRKRWSAATILGVALLLGLLLMQTACGGGGKSVTAAVSPSSPTTPASATATPVGDYAVTVTATAGTLVRTTSFTLSVR